MGGSLGGNLSLDLICSHWVSHQSPRRISVFAGVGSGGTGGGHGFTGGITYPRAVVNTNPCGVTGVPEMVNTTHPYPSHPPAKDDVMKPRAPLVTGNCNEVGLLGDVMDTFDIKKTYPSLYAPKPRDDFHRVEVPELLFLQVDGHGDPNTTPAYIDAVQALYTLSYAIRAVAKHDLGRVHTVGPLEGLWSAEDPRVFAAGKKSAWDWTMLISQPSWITPAIVDQARSTVMKKKGAPTGLDGVRLAPYAEGTSVQILHVGSYDDEAPTLARLHDEYLPAHGLTFSGRHHEIYLSDPRRTEPAKLRTILRQPVTSNLDPYCEIR